MSGSMPLCVESDSAGATPDLVNCPASVGCARMPCGPVAPAPTAQAASSAAALAPATGLEGWRTDGHHNQVDSIAHRTARYLKVAAGGTMRAQPVMLEPVHTAEQAANIRRIVHNAENLYGLLVSLDDKAALLRANFIEGRLDYQRIFTEVNEQVVAPFRDAETNVYVAGEPRLYGWVYHYAGDVFFILVITYCIEWVLRWMYFHDWRGALRPTITGLIAAFWGLGFIHLIGLALDPLMLVMPFLITARAVSHAIQMHDRYYEEFQSSGWHKRQAIVAAFAELFVPTLSGITTDAFGVLVILLVPVVMLQKLAITASWWILAITISEMLLNPIVYYYLKIGRAHV